VRRGMILLSAVLLLGTAVTAAGFTPSTKASAGAGAQPPTDLTTTVTTLVTGDRIVWPPRDGGAETPFVQRADTHGAASSFEHVKAGTQEFLVPRTAVPYLYRNLDPSLFAAKRTGPSDQVPVHVVYRSGTGTAPAPGVTVTRTTADGADGYLTPSSAKQFGAALAQQYAADTKTGDYGSAGLFAHVQSVRPLSGGGGGGLSPHYVMHTLSLKVLDGSGQPLDDGLIGVANIDDQRKFATIGVVWKGVAKFSVPAGNYTVTTQAFRYTDAAQTASESRFVTLPQVMVGADKSVTVDLRAATTRVSVHTPTPASIAVATMRYGRDDALGTQALVWDWSGDATTAFYVSATPQPAIGAEHYYSRYRLAGDGTHYDLKFPSDTGIPANQDHQVALSDLATTDASYPSEVGDRPGIEGHTGVLPWEANLVIFDYFEELDAPLHRTEYVIGDPQIAWRQAFVSYAPTVGGILIDAWRSYHPGDQRSISWGGHPEHPAVEIDTGVHPSFAPAVTRSGDLVNLFLFPYGDETVEHAGSRSPGLGTELKEDINFSLYAGDNLVAQGQYPYVQDLSVPAGPMTFRIDLDSTRTAPWFTLSNTIHTTWTFPSAHVPDSVTLPNPKWACVRFAPRHNCAAVPLPLLYYTVNGIDLTDHVAAGGPASTDITIYHAQGADPSPITAASMDVSYDGGRTWQPATLTGSGDHWTAHYTHPSLAATDGYVAIRATAKDAAGDTVTQTVLKAYALAGA
jgi:hypothetical protein